MQVNLLLLLIKLINMGKHQFNLQFKVIQHHLDRLILLEKAITLLTINFNHHITLLLKKKNSLKKLKTITFSQELLIIKFNHQYNLSKIKEKDLTVN